MSKTPTVPLSQPLGRGTAGQCSEKRGTEQDSRGTPGLRSLAALALRRDTGRDSAGTGVGQSCPTGPKPAGQVMCDISRDNQLLGDNLKAAILAYECCECGAAITEPVAMWRGGRPCHRECGDAAWRSERRDTTPQRVGQRLAPAPGVPLSQASQPVPSADFEERTGVGRSGATRSQGDEIDERDESTAAAAVERDDLTERAAIIEFGAGVPRRWSEGYAALSAVPVPTGFSSRRWQGMIDAAGGFLDRWANEAAPCGWSDLDVFGCHPDRPDAPFDAMGLIMLLDRYEIVGIDRDGADLVTQTGARQRYRRRPLPANTVSIWDLAQREHR